MDRSVFARVQPINDEGNAPHLGQSDFMISPELLVHKAVEDSLSPIQTQVFKNLFEEEDLTAWNKMQADSETVILEQVNVAVPKNATTVIDPLRVSFKRIDRVQFDLALIVNGLADSFNLFDLAPIFKTEEIGGALFLLRNAKADVRNNFLQGVKALFKGATFASAKARSGVLVQSIVKLGKKLEVKTPVRKKAVAGKRTAVKKGKAVVVKNKSEKDKK